MKLQILSQVLAWAAIVLTWYSGQLVSEATDRWLCIVLFVLGCSACGVYGACEFCLGEEEAQK